MDVGRNDPCPCGSGKKYKKCCLGAQKENLIPFPQAETELLQKEISGDEYELVVAGDVGDYGEPKLDDRLFDSIPPEELNVYSLIWNMAKQPEITKKADQLIKPFIFRGKEEARKIKKAKSSEELVEIMLSNPDSVNHSLLCDRVLENPASSISLIVSEMARPQRNSFAELAVKVIYRSNFYPEDHLLALVTQPNATAYDLSLICMLLGMLEIEEATKPLWDYYHFFKKKFPHQEYWKGPLTGLADIKYSMDHPIETTQHQCDQIVQGLEQFGINASPSQASQIIKLLYKRRVVKLSTMLTEMIDEPSQEEHEQPESGEKLVTIIVSLLQIIKQFTSLPGTNDKEQG